MPHEFNKSKEFSEVVEAIKRGNVCLWIGSGMSIAAGYPSVNKLIQILKDELEDHDVSMYFEEGDGLDIVADTFVKVHREGRLALNRILTREFSSKDNNSHFHDLLVKVPYFKSIITTNYDSLIEDTFTNRRCLVIRKPEDFLNGNAGTTKIFKIHGCLQNLDGVIISKNDYEKLYRRSDKSILSILDSEIIRYQYHLFIGYGFNDGNIRADFEYIQGDILDKSNKLKIFHVSPNDLQPKESLDFISKRIHHFTASGDSFLQEVIKSLKASISIDLGKGIIDASNAKKFAESFDVKISFDNSLSSISSIKALGRDTEHKLTFSTKPEFALDVKAFVEGDNRFEFTIGKDFIKNFDYNIEDFSLLNMENFEKLKIQRAPCKEGKASMYFRNKDFRIELDDYTLFSWGKGNYRIIVKKNAYEIIFSKGSDGGIKLSLDPPTKSGNIFYADQFYYALYLFASGEVFDVFLDSGESFLNYSLSMSPLLKWSLNRHLFYSSLLKIEQKTSRRFTNFDESVVTNDVYVEVLKLASLFEKGYYDQEFKTPLELEEISASSIREKVILNTIITDNMCVLCTTKSHTFSIFEQEFAFENKIMIIHEPYFFEENGKLMVRPNKDNMRYTFEELEYYNSISNLKEIWSK